MHDSEANAPPAGTSAADFGVCENARLGTISAEGLAYASMTHPRSANRPRTEATTNATAQRPHRRLGWVFASGVLGSVAGGESVFGVTATVYDSASIR